MNSNHQQPIKGCTRAGACSCSCSDRSKNNSRQQQQQQQQTKQQQQRNTESGIESSSEYIILTELPDISIGKFSQEDVILYAKQIGIDPQSESDLLWIAEKGLSSNLPFPWIAVEDQKGRLFYFNSLTEESSWEHPSDSYYRSLAEQERIKGSSTTITMSGLTSLANLHFVDEEMSLKSDNANEYGNKSVGKKEIVSSSKNIKSKTDYVNVNGNENVVADMAKSDGNENNEEDDVESVDFASDIEAALDDLSNSGGNVIDLNEDRDELVTLDWTDGSNYDSSKQFKEVHSIEINPSMLDNKKDYTLKEAESSYNSDNKSKIDKQRNSSNKIESNKESYNSVDVLDEHRRDSNKMKMQSSSSEESFLSPAHPKPKLNAKQENNEQDDDDQLLTVKREIADSELVKVTSKRNEIWDENEDEFMLEVGNEDPFADFTSHDQNVNVLDLFRIKTTGDKSSMQARDRNSNKSATQSYNGIKENQLEQEQHQLQTSNQSLETVEEEKDDFGGENESENDNEDEDEGEEIEGIGNDEDDEENEEEVEEEEEENENDEERIDAVELERRFDEMKNELSNQIETLRNELRQELGKQRKAINKEVKEQVDQLDWRIERNEKELRETKNAVKDIERLSQKTKDYNESMLPDSALTHSADLEKIRSEMQLQSKSIKEELQQSIRDLNQQFNKELKWKVETSLDEFENTSFSEFKGENQREIGSLRDDLASLMSWSNSNINITQQTSELREDLSLALSQIDKQKRATNKQLENMKFNFEQEVSKLEDEIKRMKGEMKRSNVSKEEEKESIMEMGMGMGMVLREEEEMSGSLLLEKNQNRTENSRVHSLEKCDHKFNLLNAHFEHLQQQVDTFLNIINGNTNENIKKKEVMLIKNADNEANNKVPHSQNDSLFDPKDNLYERVLSIEVNVNRICDTLSEIKPIIGNNISQSQKGKRTTFSSANAVNAHHKQDAAYFDAKSVPFPNKVKIFQFSDDEGNISNASSSSGSLSTTQSDMEGKKKSVHNLKIPKHRRKYKKKRHLARQDSSSSADSFYELNKNIRSSKLTFPISVAKHSHESGHHHSHHTHSHYHPYNDEHYLPTKSPHSTRVAVMTSPSWESERKKRTKAAQHHPHHYQYRDIKTTSSSLINLIKKTTRKLKEESLELESMGKYNFTSDIGSSIGGLRGEESGGEDSEQHTIRKLKLIRIDVDEKLKRLTNVLNQQKSSQL